MSAWPTISAIVACAVAALGLAAMPAGATAAADCSTVEMGTAGRDKLVGTESADGISGAPGADVLLGLDHADCLRGGPHRDVIRGGSGRDRIEAGSGRDLIVTRDGQRDTVSCGPGRDRVRADHKDVVRHCEKVSRAKTRPTRPSDPGDETDGGDPAPPPSGDGPPSGTVVQADYVDRACPIDGIWGGVMDAHFSTTNCSNWNDSADPQVDHSASGGYPLPARDGRVHDGYRRLRLTDGRQSIYDAGVGNSSYRTQLISNSELRTYHPMQPGHRYVWWVSVRFQASTPLTSDRVVDDSQVWQIKNTGNCAPRDTVGPVSTMSEGARVIHLKNRQRDGDLRVDSFPLGPRGVWQMFAFDVLYSNDPSKAAYRLWGDQDGDSTLDLEPLTPKLTGRVTAVGPSCVGKPSMGPYQPMSLPAVYRDYGVNELVEVPLGADWE